MTHDHAHDSADAVTPWLTEYHNTTRRTRIPYLAALYSIPQPNPKPHRRELISFPTS